MQRGEFRVVRNKRNEIGCGAGIYCGRDHHRHIVVIVLTAFAASPFTATSAAGCGNR